MKPGRAWERTIFQRPGRPVREGRSCIPGVRGVPLGRMVLGGLWSYATGLHVTSPALIPTMFIDIVL